MHRVNNYVYNKYWTGYKQNANLILQQFYHAESRGSNEDKSLSRVWSPTLFYSILFSFATRAGSPQQRETITVGPYYLTPRSIFPVGGSRSTRREPTTFSRALTILSSHEDWVRAHIKRNLTGDRTQYLRGERQVVWPLHHQSPSQLSRLNSHLLIFAFAETWSMNRQSMLWTSLGIFAYFVV